MRVRLIEDDPMIGKAVRQGLRSAGFVVDWVVDGGSAETSLSRHDYALAVLDLGLPSQDGMQVLHKLRARGATLPVLITSARDAVTDRIAGLDAGADDYLAKPFDLGELVARAHAQLRRHAGRCQSGAELRRADPRSGAAPCHAARRRSRAVAARNSPSSMR